MITKKHTVAIAVVILVLLGLWAATSDILASHSLPTTSSTEANGAGSSSPTPAVSVSTPTSPTTSQTSSGSSATQTLTLSQVDNVTGGSWQENSSTGGKITSPTVTTINGAKLSPAGIIGTGASIFTENGLTLSAFWTEYSNQSAATSSIYAFSNQTGVLNGTIGGAHYFYYSSAAFINESDIVAYDGNYTMDILVTNGTISLQQAKQLIAGQIVDLKIK
ncbi:MAG: hypothetical protein M1448_01340 [Candidatus Marsarchaeota archaeon]|nr:hypothetical protein [Candidatus Marsarchaeota archaeon]